jgi:hypothetical protein
MEIWKYILFLFAIVFIDCIGCCLIFYFSKFVYKVRLNNNKLIFDYKKYSVTYDFQNCDLISTNGYITKFMFEKNVIRCFNKDFIPSSDVEKLNDIINEEYFINAKIINYTGFRF